MHHVDSKGNHMVLSHHLQYSHSVLLKAQITDSLNNLKKNPQKSIFLKFVCT